MAAKKKEGAKLIRCRTICKRWDSNRPGEPRRLIEAGEIVYYPAGKELPSDLKPIPREEPVEPPQTEDEPRAFSEVQRTYPAQRPEGA